MTDPFHPHDGSPCPIDRDSWIEVQFRDPAEPPAPYVRRDFGFAWQYVWQHDGAGDDIIGYRAAPVPQQRGN